MACEAIVIGGSHGSFQLLGALLPQIQPRVPILICVHLPRGQGVSFASAFAARCRYPVTEANDKDAVVPGHAYLAPGGYHLLVERDFTLSLSSDGPVNHAQPSIDVLFESAAAAWGNRLAALLVTGASADGAAGMATVAAFGGHTIVQDPADAQAAVMPRAALERMAPHATLPAADMAPALNRLIEATP